MPSGNDAGDFGAYGFAWGDMYSSGTVWLGTVNNTGAKTNSGNLNVGNNLSVDGFVNVSSTLGVTGATTFFGNVTFGQTGGGSVDIDINSASFSGFLRPALNNSFDIGEWGSFTGPTFSWNDVHASGTVHSATSTIKNTTGSTTLMIYDGGTGGPEIIMHDSDDATACTSITVQNGVVLGSVVTCPAIL